MMRRASLTLVLCISSLALLGGCRKSDTTTETSLTPYEQYTYDQTYSEPEPILSLEYTAINTISDPFEKEMYLEFHQMIRSLKIKEYDAVNEEVCMVRRISKNPRLRDAFRDVKETGADVFLGTSFSPAEEPLFINPCASDKKIIAFLKEVAKKAERKAADPWDCEPCKTKTTP